MPLEPRDAALLWDMLQAAEAIRRFTKGKSLDDYQTDELLQSAVERKVEILGEAARRLSEGFRQAHPEIPWKAIAGQRNVVVHEYGAILHDRLWAVVQRHIPKLVESIEPLIPPIPPELDL